MSSRQTGLPEGTDHIVDTNIDLGAGDGAKSGAGGAKRRAAAKSKTETQAAASAASPAKTTVFQFDKQGEGAAAVEGIVGQVRDQIGTLKSQASDKAREYADDGKSRATSLLQNLAEILSDASGSVEGKFGDQYAGVGRKASDSIKSLASTLDERSVDDLIEDARAFVQRSPAVAIGIAAVLGFAVARVMRSSISEFREDSAANDRDA